MIKMLLVGGNWIAQIQDLSVLKPFNFFKIGEKLRTQRH